MIKLCIFDLDGTLIDSVPDLTNSLNHALAALHLPLKTRLEAQDFVGHGLSNFLKRSIPNDLNADDHIDQLKDLFMEHYAAHCTDESAVYDGIAEALSVLAARGIVLAINTNKAQVFLDKIMRDLFAGVRFDAIIGAGSYPQKPDPEAAFEILKRTGAKTSECVYIGDSTVDVRTAKNAGVTSVGITWGYGAEEGLAQAGADQIVRTPQELADLICAL